MESWNDIINAPVTELDPDIIVLPAPNDVELEGATNLRREISYKYDEENPEMIIRTECTYEIVNIKKKISTEAIRRKERWTKFGAVKDVPKGTLERGVTNQREGHFPFLWNGIKMMKKVRSIQKAIPKARPKAAEQEKEALPKPAPSGKYVRPGLRDSGGGGGPFEEEDKAEIKISNLPQWSDFGNVKHLIDEFYRRVLGASYIPKYRIRMIPSRRTLEEWNSDKKAYAHRLAEYERLAIVEFENEAKAKKAIEVLDGHRFSAHILRVEKAKPRIPR